MTKTYVTLGHVTNDVQTDGTSSPGGTVYYSARTAKRLGWEPFIITACGQNYAPPAELRGTRWRLARSSRTTSFCNVYGPRGRTQRITSRASPLTGADIPRSVLLGGLVHLAPVAGELDTSIVDVLAGSRVFATLQGWLRRWDQQGNVEFAELPSPGDLLPRLEAAVVSIEDLVGDMSRAEEWAKLTGVLVVTEERHGCTVFHRGRRVRVPPRPVARVADPTGAGDIFAAAFFTHYAEHGEVLQAARFANVTASIAIETAETRATPDHGSYGKELRA